MDVSALLSGFGFTQLEALIYCELLRKAPATGYRLARETGKAPPNIYQTLKGLMQKGAIVEAEEDKGGASYIPVPPRRLFAALRREFEERHDAAVEALEAIHRPAAQETVYQLRNVAQVFEHARTMINGASEVVVFDMVPQILDMLRPELDAAIARGARTIGIAYRPEDARPTVPYNGETPADVEGRWPGLGLILIVDGREQLIAQISRDMESVLNAIYSDSVFLSSVLHSAVSSDIRLVALRGDENDPLAGISLQRSTPPGLRDLLGSAKPAREGPGSSG